MPRTPSASVWTTAPSIHFLPKPFSLKQLAAKVKEVLEPHAAASGQPFS